MSKNAVYLAGLAMGAMRTRRQFADEDRHAALVAAGNSQQAAALAHHVDADRHEAAILEHMTNIVALSCTTNLAALAA